MAEPVPLEDLVPDAHVLTTLDETPPPLNIHTDLGIKQTAPLQNTNNVNQGRELISNRGYHR